MCYKFCCFGTSELLALRPASRKNSSSIRLLLTSPSRTCHGSHRTSCQGSVGHTGATTLEGCLDFIVGSCKGSNSHWHGCNTAPSAPPSPVAVKHRAPVTSSPRQLTPHSDPSPSVSWLLSFVNTAVIFQ